jgi:hypothetical protein
VPISNFNYGRIALWKMLKYVQLPQNWALSRAQALLLEVYTPSRMAPESRRCLAKKPAMMPIIFRQDAYLDAFRAPQATHWAVLTLLTWETQQKDPSVAR